MKKILKIGILVSGTGSNMLAIILACLRGFIPGKVVCVISNMPGVKALETAEKYGLPALCISHRDFSSREEYDEELANVLQSYEVELVCLAGFMRIVSSVLLNAFKNAVMNIHPALLPDFPGENAQRQALDAGAKVSGCTVHFADEGVDTGPIILQRSVSVLEGDDEKSLSARILIEEHQAYPEAIRLFAEGRLQVEGRQITILPDVT